MQITVPFTFEATYTRVRTRRNEKGIFTDNAQVQIRNIKPDKAPVVMVSPSAGFERKIRVSDGKVWCGSGYQLLNQATGEMSPSGARFLSGYLGVHLNVPYRSIDAVEVTKVLASARDSELARVHANARKLAVCNGELCFNATHLFPEALLPKAAPDAIVPTEPAPENPAEQADDGPSLRAAAA